MTRKLLGTALSLLLAMILITPVFSGTERELQWDDLIPDTVVFNDPFEALNREQLEYMGFVARVRNMLAAGNAISQETIDEAAQIEKELNENGIDIDALLARRDEIRELRKKKAYAVVSELDGTSIKMPGYVLPLEYSGLNVTEFLLVPWVGACIHTPPPPPNQIVHVLLDEKDAFKSKSTFEPVWVTGQIVTKASTQNLFLKDGSGDFNIGYRLNASRVEQYKQ